MSTKGYDGWSGRIAAPNAAHSDGPLATIARARDVIRTLRREKEGLERPITVWVRGGSCYLDEPLVFTHEDSGTPQCPITYAAYRKEKPIISGGRRITGWKRTEVNGKRAWMVSIPEVKAGEWEFRQLFVNGQRRPRTRLPREEFYRWTELPGVTAETKWNQGQRQAKFAPGEIKAWRNLTDVEIVAPHLWVDSHLSIASVDEEQNLVTFAQESVFRLTDGFGGGMGRYFVENVFEALDTPGQWYLDRPAGVLYYLPLPGEDPRKAEVIAPRLEQLVRFDGAAEGEAGIHDLHLQGLSFVHSDWRYPADKAGDSQAAVSVPGAIVLRNAHDCSIDGCTVAHVSNYAIELLKGCRNNAVVGNDLYDLGAGGVKVGHDSSATIVSDNHIHQGGRIYLSAVGVWVGNSGGNQIVHNHVHDLYYSGLSIGWRWGYGDSNAVRNVVEYNHIHDIGHGILSDMGGIYTLGISPGTRLTHNLIHDIENYGYGGWGIYLDEGSSTILVEDNVVYRANTGGFHQHYGKDNLIRNNIFAMAKQGQIVRSRPEEHLSFTFERNIVYWSEGPLLSGNWKGGCELDHNLYWKAGGGDFDFAGMSLEDWRKSGQDEHSVMVDPLFLAPGQDNFTLKADSPALGIGFEAIDLTTVGPRR
ncbi:hypothetical protein AMK68_01660 [candidate division KD3-62 bacterium DG_56]|uniref:Uncharacterized protein n=1 Tax=candidate division KD3-62 bacterium DG_56 TaxID=1704032 RepID=A0A0S7XQI3_9BACT|nr:MAG: hypothetical protein AMK68_01660 [candidate division KD3-62 bacterium DG_56]